MKCSVVVLAMVLEDTRCRCRARLCEDGAPSKQRVSAQNCPASLRSWSVRWESTILRQPGGLGTQLWSLIHSVLILGASCLPALGQSHCCTLRGGCPGLRLPEEEENEGDEDCRLQRAGHKGTPTHQGAAAAE